MLTLVGFDLRYELVESVPGLSARFGRHQRQDLSQHFEMVGFSSDGVDIHVLFFWLGESPHFWRNLVGSDYSDFPSKEITLSAT